MPLFENMPSLMMGIHSEFDELFDGPLTPIEDEETISGHVETISKPTANVRTISGPNTDLEDGEIQEPRKESLAKKGTSRKRRRVLNAEGRAELDRKAAEEKNKFIENVLSQIYGEDQVFVHRVSKKPDYFRKLCDLESSTNAPLSADDVAFPKEQTEWIHEPGLHLGLDADNGVVFAIKIRPFADMLPNRKKATMECLTTIMNWTLCVPEITLNASQTKPHGEEASEAPPEGRKRNGTMYAAGWHAPMEKNKLVVYYTVKPSQRAQELYEHCIGKLSQVARFYRDGICSIFPGGAKRVDDYAVENLIPSFSTLTLDGDSDERPFTNSLTITRGDFSNYQHQDKDEIEIAYGLWWPAAVSKVGRYTHYAIDDKVGHNKIKGGGFLWGEYAIAVDFERCDGLVEIYWRGKIDFHGTMQSVSTTNTTRFGTSVQLTRKGTRAVARFWASGGDVTESTTPEDRLQTAASKLSLKRAKQ